MTEPIYALDLDEDLLSHMPDPEAWVVIQGEKITSEIIEDEFVAQVFEWQRLHIREHHQPATAAVLEHEFDLELAPPETVIGDLLDRLRDRYAKNEGRRSLRKLVETQQDEPSRVPKMLIEEGRRLAHIVVPKGDVYGTGDVERALHQYDLKVQAGPGASYGHPDLDDYFYGMKGLNFIVAPPKTYKSWQIIQAVVGNALNGTCTALFTLELPAVETDMRLRCMLANVPWWHYLRNCISTNERKRIQEASEIIDESGIYQIMKPPAGERGIDDLVYQARDAGADAIFIDQLQYVEGGQGLPLGTHNKTGEYWQVLNRARDLSDDGPIMIAHQFNRSTLFSDSMPSMEQIKGSSSVEETATLALGMWSNHDMRKSGLLEIGVLCSRNYQYAAWEMEVELSRGCGFQIIGRVQDDE